MRRLEVVFGAVVTALAIFVAVEARGARVYSQYLGGAVSAPFAEASPNSSSSLRTLLPPAPKPKVYSSFHHKLAQNLACA